LSFILKYGNIYHMADIIGNGPILAFFEKVIDKGNLSHAYCFVGVKGSGKLETTRQIGAKLLGVGVEKLGSQPDFVVVEQMFDEKKEKTKKDISIEQLRDLREFLCRHSYLGGYKVAVINEAEKMSLEAANALLKTLEEPKEKTILFLLTKDEKELPETVLSRCQVIFFSAPVQNYLYQTRKEEFIRFDSLINKPFFEKLKIVEDLFGDKTDHIAARENLQEVLDVWLLSIREAIKNNSLPKENILQIEERIQEAKKMLGQNVHPRLLLENILLQIK